MNNAFFFDNKSDLLYFLENDWDDTKDITLQKRLTQWVVIVQ